MMTSKIVLQCCMFKNKDKMKYITKMKLYMYIDMYMCINITIITTTIDHHMMTPNCLAVVHVQARGHNVRD